MKGRYEPSDILQRTGGLSYEFMPIQIARSTIFNSKTYSARPLYSSWICVTCEREVLDDKTQRGMKRIKCDYCIKEKDRLVNTMRYWMKKVGVYFDLEGDWN